ncbi:MAG: hypothetical protein KJO49_01040, partial [Bacteroidia bacterium]|nr:hypothetical protein [Bacteroidia bacterium]
MKNWLFMFVLAFSCVFNSDTLAQIKWSDFDDYKYYSEEEGLVSGSSWDIVEDKDGFLWITTRQGITRFDGKEFTNYSYYFEEGNRRELGKAWKIVFDELWDNIYVITSNGVFTSKRTEIILKPIKKIYPSIPFEVSHGFSLFFDNQKHLWVGTFGNGLIKIDLIGTSHDIKLFKQTGLSKQERVWLNEINTIKPDNQDKDILWLGTAQGLIKFNKLTNAYQVYYYKNNKDYFENNIWHIVPTPNDIFLGTANNNWYGINRTDSSTFQPIKEGEPNYFYGIRSMYLDNDKYLWITSDIGLVQYDTRTQTVIKGDASDYNELTFKGVKLIDSRNIIWCTSDIGLFKYETSHAVKHIEFDNNRNFAYQSKPISIIREKNSFIIATNFGEGIYKLNIGDWSFKVIPIPVLSYEPPRGYLIRDMIKTNEDNMLLLGNRKAYIYNNTSETFIEPSMQIPDSSLIYVRNVAKDMNNNYWIATNQDGLYKFNYENFTFEKHIDLFKGDNPRDHQYIKELFVDSNNNLWIGQAATSVLNLNNMTFNRFNPDFDYNSAIGFGGFLETDNRVWV